MLTNGRENRCFLADVVPWVIYQAAAHVAVQATAACTLPSHAPHHPSTEHHLFGFHNFRLAFPVGLFVVVAAPYVHKHLRLLWYTYRAYTELRSSAPGPVFDGCLHLQLLGTAAYTYNHLYVCAGGSVVRAPTTTSSCAGKLSSVMRWAHLRWASGPSSWGAPQLGRCPVRWSSSLGLQNRPRAGGTQRAAARTDVPCSW